MRPSPTNLFMLSRRVGQQLGLLLRPVQRPIAAGSSAAASALNCSPPQAVGVRHGSSSSSTRWKTRQGSDHFAREARVQGLKSRAAFKLLEINEKYKLFKPGQTIVDLGFAPGSWSQVAANRSGSTGRVVGIDLIPAQPPRGVSTIQGNFLSPEIQAQVRAYVQDPELGRPRAQIAATEEHKEGYTEKDIEEIEKGYIDVERQANLEGAQKEATTGKVRLAKDGTAVPQKLSLKERDRQNGRVVDVVLSDMMANTSGIAFKDHTNSMDLCLAALTFAHDTLRTGGHFVCKFYQGAEDKAFEMKLKRLFARVSREKPDSSRSESKEAYFVALRRKEAPTKEDVLRD